MGCSNTKVLHAEAVAKEALEAKRIAEIDAQEKANYIEIIDGHMKSMDEQLNILKRDKADLEKSFNEKKLESIAKSQLLDKFIQEKALKDAEENKRKKIELLKIYKKIAEEKVVLDLKIALNNISTLISSQSKSSESEVKVIVRKKKIKRRHHKKREIEKHTEEEIEPVNIDRSKYGKYHQTYSEENVSSDTKKLFVPETQHFHKKYKCWNGSWADDYSSEDDGKSPDEILASYESAYVWSENDSYAYNDRMLPSQNDNSQNLPLDLKIRIKPDIVWSSSLKRYVAPDYSPNEIEINDSLKRKNAIVSS